MPERIVYAEHGKPSEVLKHESFDLPELREGEVLIELCFANINPSDMGMIGGSYGTLPELPAIPGREGVGRISSAHASVKHVKPGDLVRIPAASGAWQSHIVADASELWVLPEGIDAQQAAMLFVNPPTALMLLEQFVDLQPGDWIIQNAANSQVGLWVIQLAKARGLHTLNVVRREGLEEELKNLGADHVIVDGPDYPKSIRALTGGAKPRLALNSVGGESVIQMIKTLADGGVCVTFGGMVGDPVRFPTRFLIFNDIQLRGFWMDKWMRTHQEQEIRALYERVFDAVLHSGITTPVEAVYSLCDVQSALLAFQKPRLGKILLQP